MAYRSFEDLEVREKACRLAVRVYHVLRDCEDLGLKGQMTRAAVSIASNIAEGAGRGSKAGFIRFIHIAKGSAAELRTQVYIASRIKVISDEVQKEVISELEGLSGMLHGLIKSLES